MIIDLQYPLPGLSHCDWPDLRSFTGGAENLQYPLPGLSHCDLSAIERICREYSSLQYPLPGLSHCDSPKIRRSCYTSTACSTLYRAYPIATFLYRLALRLLLTSCSTLYRAYPIATFLMSTETSEDASLQYPLPGLSHCDNSRYPGWYSPASLAVPSTGPIPLRHAIVLLAPSSGLSCSTLYRAYPIATFGRLLAACRLDGTLQYPLPGLSHCDLAMDHSLPPLFHLQYPLPGLSHCDP